MIDLDLPALKKSCEAAPTEIQPDYSDPLSRPLSQCYSFYSTARTALPQLIAEVERLQAVPVQVNTFWHKDMTAEQLENVITAKLREENQTLCHLLRQTLVWVPGLGELATRIRAALGEK